MTDSDRVAYEPGAEIVGQYRATYNWTSMEPSTGIIETVADAANRESLGLSPLYDSIDPDALDSLFRLSDEAVSVSFTYEGFEITADSDGEVVLRPSSADRGPGL
ncbi:HalOD1 output domain-containing protein [Halorubrum cibi]|uniref:Halobacterial output domain-containing protein n=1 Tax=Halorubrum cibi TaxID=413815 RepID=A0A521C2X2_9EURY|nr:HalOD1 output domain-containing protein [Halorubrum cibi]SMO53748.1 hypothetical protein SAMN06264867_103262 [Halorubrum cibi]